MKYTIEYDYLQGFNYPYEVTALDGENRVVACTTSDKSFSHAKEKVVSEIKAIAQRGEIIVPSPETINIIANPNEDQFQKAGILSIIKEANEETK